MNQRLHISQLVDTNALGRAMRSGLVTRRWLAGEQLSVLNYTPKATWTNTWNPVTVVCRGLVVDGEGWVIARPFAKFFEIEALDEIPDEPFIATEKYDGSLAILYPRNDGPAVTTRGNPNSWQSMQATLLLRHKYESYTSPAGTTLLCELLLPGNRLIVDYGDRHELIALAAIDIATGSELPIPDDWPGPRAKQHPASTLAELAAQDQAGREGCVVYWPQADVRAKVKFEDYEQKWHSAFVATDKAVWEALDAGGDPVDWLRQRHVGCPGELVAWVEQAVQRLTCQRDLLLADHQRQVDESKGWDGRTGRTVNRKLLEALRDGQTEKARKLAWEAVRPDGTGEHYGDTVPEHENLDETI